MHLLLSILTALTVLSVPKDKVGRRSCSDPASWK